MDVVFDNTLCSLFIYVILVLVDRIDTQVFIVAQYLGILVLALAL